MPKYFKIILFLILFSVISASAISHNNVFGGACEAIVSSTNISSNSSGTLNFNLGSDLGANIVWVKINSPTSSFTITGGSKEGWSSEVSSSSIVYTGGSQSSGTSAFYPAIVSTSLESPQARWTVQVSSSADGSSPTTCYGNSWVAISESGADLEAPDLTSGISVSGSKNYVTLAWTTNEAATSTIQYGTTNAYGSTQTTSSLSANHSVTITGLSANTLYHFNIQVSDQWGNSRDLGDETFTIPDVETVTNTITVTNTTVVNKTIIKEIRDEIKPLAKFSLDFTKIYRTAPEVTGTATDEGGVAYVLYSVDDGKNYIPAQIVEKIGSKSVTFKFTPEVRDDGNYKTRVKTVDSSGNESITDLNELIIDRLPPKPLGVLLSIGPLVLQNDIKGYTEVMVDSPVKITLSAIGGPTSLEIVTGDKTFPLTKNIESGLWSGNIIFEKVGEINLIARGIDGANNETLTLVGKVNVIDTGFVNPNSELGVYVFDPIKSQFVLWNGSTYEISNPQKIGQDGRYKVLLPNGKYYIEVSSLGFKPLRTAIFEISEEKYINSKLSLERKKYFWDIFSTQINLKEEQESVHDALSESISGKYLPDFNIGRLSNNSLLGKPSLLSIVSTWMPNTSEQIKELQKVQNSLKNSKLYIVAEQETDSGLSVFKKLGGYDLNFYADPDGNI